MSDIIASLVAKITADTSGLDTGLNAANAKLQNMGKNMSALGGAFPGDQLGADFQRYQNSLGATSQATTGLTAKNVGLMASITGIRSAWMQFGLNAAFIAAPIAALATGVKYLHDVGEAGAEIEYTSNKFDRLANSVGTTGQAMLTDLRTATKGTVSDFDLMKQGADLFQLGLANDAGEAIRLSRVMTALGMDTGQLVLALANQSKRRLDQLGLSLSTFNKYEKEFKDLGLGKEEAFKQAFLKTAEETVVLTGNKADEAVGSYSRLTAGWENYTNSVKASMADTFVPANEALGNFFNTQAEGVKATQDLQKWQASAIQNYREYLKATGQSPNAPAYRAYAWQRLQDRAATYERVSARDDGTVPTPAAAGAAAVDYTGMLQAGTSLTDMTAKYNEELNKVAEKLIDAPRKYGATKEQADALKNSLTGLNAMSDEYNITLMQQLQALTAAEGQYGKNDSRVREMRESIAGLRADFTSANNEMLMGMIKNKEGTDEQQVTFARATGMISEQAFQQAMALNKIADAYVNQQLTASQAADAARGVANGLSTINGFNAIAYVDVYVRVHGDPLAGYGGMQGSGARETNISPGFQGPAQRNAVGGPVGAGEISGITEYGDPEIFSSGGKRYLISGKPGYVSTLSGQSGEGASRDEQMYAVLSRIPSAQENARALVKEMAKYWPRSA